MNQSSPQTPSAEAIKAARAELWHVLRYGSNQNDKIDMEHIAKALELLGGSIPEPV